MDALHHLLDLSMSISSCETDREALLEAHATLSALSDDCGRPAAVWPLRENRARPLQQSRLAA